jgi:L-asparagine transporter-like permease
LDKQIFARKPVSMFLEERSQSGLRRVLGKWGLTSMGIGAIIGAGIFVLTGLAAKVYAGPALALSFVIAGIGCTLLLYVMPNLLHSSQSKDLPMPILMQQWVNYLHGLLVGT